MPKGLPKTAFDLYKSAMEIGLERAVFRDTKTKLTFYLACEAFYPKMNGAYFFTDETDPHDYFFEVRDFSRLEIIGQIPLPQKRPNLAALRKQSRQDRTSKFQIITYHKRCRREE